MLKILRFYKQKLWFVYTIIQKNICFISKSKARGTDAEI